MDNLDYYILTDRARKLAYEVGDLIGELPHSRKYGTSDKTVANIKACISQLTNMVKELEQDSNDNN